MGDVISTPSIFWGPGVMGAGAGLGWGGGGGAAWGCGGGGGACTAAVVTVMGTDHQKRISQSIQRSFGCVSCYISMRIEQYMWHQSSVILRTRCHGCLGHEVHPLQRSHLRREACLVLVSDQCSAGQERGSFSAKPLWSGPALVSRHWQKKLACPLVAGLVA